MKAPRLLSYANVAALALLLLSPSAVSGAAPSPATTPAAGAQNANAGARRKAGRKRRTRRRAAAAKEPTGEIIIASPNVVPGNPDVGVTADDGRQEKSKSTPKKTIVTGGVLNGKAVSKPAPEYPAIAKAARAQGTVTVQVVVGEDGRVISANAVSGHPLLQSAAVAAARQARFSPTFLSGQPVKVSGVITYNFVLGPPPPPAN